MIEAEKEMNKKMISSLKRYISGLITREEFHAEIDVLVREYLKSLTKRR